VRERGMANVCTRTLTFDALLTRTDFVEDMRSMLHTLQEAYDHPVDIEYTCNFIDETIYKTNLLQCRPLQIKADIAIEERPESIPKEDLVLETRGPVIGRSRISAIDRVVYVAPSVYGQLPLSERYTVARCIGRLMHLDEPKPPETIMLLGPGRWGTTTPSLGVPVSFAEINTVSIMCEIVAMRDDLVPDVSLGTHFFSELVEMEILYMALFPNQPGNVLDAAFFEGQPSLLTALLPDAGPFENVIRVFDPRTWADKATLKLHANTPKQNVVCYIDRKDT